LPVAEIDYLEPIDGDASGIPELPQMTAEDFGGAAPDVQEHDELYPGWSEETVTTFMQGAGAGIHMVWGVAEKDWLLTKTDIDRIIPPLTRILNRYEPTLRLSPYADPFLLAYGLALYGWRSALERQRALRDREPLEEPDEPETVSHQVHDDHPNGSRPARDPDADRWAPMFPESSRAEKGNTQ
jgi:hypothetical protein